MKNISGRFAAEGFFVLAPDLITESNMEAVAKAWEEVKKFLTEYR